MLPEDLTAASAPKWQKLRNQALISIPAHWAGRSLVANQSDACRISLTGLGVILRAPGVDAGSTLRPCPASIAIKGFYCAGGPRN